MTLVITESGPFSVPLGVGEGKVYDLESNGMDWLSGSISIRTSTTDTPGGANTVLEWDVRWSTDGVFFPAQYLAITINEQIAAGLTGYRVPVQARYLKLTPTLAGDKGTTPTLTVTESTAGVTGSATVDAVAEVTTLDTGTANSGTFTLTVTVPKTAPATTPALAWDISAVDLAAALEALVKGPVVVEGSGRTADKWKITFDEGDGALAVSGTATLLENLPLFTGVSHQIIPAFA